MSTIFQLEDALVEFFAQNTYEYLFPSNEQTTTKVPPTVWAGFIPRDQVGGVLPGEITTYPCIIVGARRGTQAHDAQYGIDREMVEVEVLLGVFDSNLDQQGFRDAMIMVQRLKDRLREVDIIRERFPIRMPLKWEVNRFYGGASTNYWPYFFGEMLLTFELPIMVTQYDIGVLDGETTPGRYNEFPIPSPSPSPT